MIAKRGGTIYIVYYHKWKQSLAEELQVIVMNLMPIYKLSIHRVECFLIVSTRWEHKEVYIRTLANGIHSGRKA